MPAPMLAFSASPFIGPVLGPLVSGFINQNTNWRWTYYTIIIWAGVMMALLLVFVRESYSPILLRKKARQWVISRIVYHQAADL